MRHHPETTGESWGKKKLTDRKYRAAQRDIRNMQLREWRLKNPDKVRVHREKSKVQKLARTMRLRKKNYVLTNNLKTKACMDCRNFFPPECMDFDHVRGEKKFNISRNMGGATQSLLKEITKCDLVCACCHRIRTKKRMNT